MTARAEELSVWLGGVPVAVVERRRSRGRTLLRTRYTDAAFAHYDVGVPILSVSLALRRPPFGHEETERYFGGLLPEGPALSTIA